MELNEERKNRYFSKCGYIIEKMDTIPDNVDDYENIDTELILQNLENVKKQLHRFVNIVEGELS